MKVENDIVSVTGSNGRIGDAVMRRLRRRVHNVVGLDRPAPGPPPSDCIHIPVDFASDDSLQEGLREHHGASVATVVHPAVYYDFLSNPTPLYEEIVAQRPAPLNKAWKSVVSPRLRIIGQYSKGFALVSGQGVHAVVSESHCSRGVV